MVENSVKQERNRKIHPNSLKNLEAGRNKKGRPRKEQCITHLQREMLPLPCPYAPGKTWLEWLADRGMAQAGGNATYYKELMERLEGKVVQPVEGQIDSDVIFTIGKGYDRDRNEEDSNKL